MSAANDNAPPDGGMQWQLILSFPDASDSFCNGFEAGGIWTMLRMGASTISRRCVHTANVELYRDMASKNGYRVEFDPTEYEEWTWMEMTKVSPATGLSVVQN